MNQQPENALPESDQMVEAAAVELFDSGVSLGMATMTGPTTWSKEVSALSVGGHVFVARNASGMPTSSPWSVSVINPLLGSETFDSVSPVILAPGESVEAPTMTITYVSGTGDMGIQDVSWTGGMFPDPGKIEGHVLHIGRSGPSGAKVVRLELKGECSSVSFYQYYSSALQNYATYYNRAGVLLGTKYLEHSVSSSLHSFSASGIARIELHTGPGQWVRLDHFTFS